MNGDRVHRTAISRPHERTIIVRDDGAVVAHSSNAHPTRDEQDAQLEVLGPTGTRVLLSNVIPWPARSYLAPVMALSPDGSALAVFVADESLAIFDLDSGKLRRSFAAPIPGTNGTNRPDAGVLWVSPNRIAIVGTRFVKLWAVDGTDVAVLTPP